MTVTKTTTTPHHVRRYCCCVCLLQLVSRVSNIWLTTEPDESLTPSVCLSV